MQLLQFARHNRVAELQFRTLTPILGAVRGAPVRKALGDQIKYLDSTSFEQRTILDARQITRFHVEALPRSNSRTRSNKGHTAKKVSVHINQDEGGSR